MPQTTAPPPEPTAPAAAMEDAALLQAVASAPADDPRLPALVAELARRLDTERGAE